MRSFIKRFFETFGIFGYTSCAVICLGIFVFLLSMLLFVAFNIDILDVGFNIVFILLIIGLTLPLLVIAAAEGLAVFILGIIGWIILIATVATSLFTDWM